VAKWYHKAETPTNVLPRSTLVTRLNRLAAFWHYFWRRFDESHCTHSAAALSYTTLLALVPLLALSLAVFTAFPAFHEVSDKLMNAAFELLVPAARETIQQYVYTFAEKAKKLTGPGVLFLIVTALMLMVTIERALNEIWCAPPYRTLHRRLMVYWSVLTLGPLLVGAGIVLTSRIVATAHLEEQPGPELLKLLPFLLEGVAFTLLFLVVPNARVKVRLAVAGGFLSAALFEAAKAGFAAYITHFPTYEAIYGALAAVPIFLVWLYLSWMVTLLGAQFTFCLHTFRYGDPAQAAPLPEHDLDLAYQVLRQIWRGQRQGSGSDESELIRSLPHIDPATLDRVLHRLRRHRWVARDEEGYWLLRRDPHLHSLLDLYRSHPFILPPSRTAQPELRPLLTPVENEIGHRFAVPLARLFETPPPTSTAEDGKAV